MKKRFLWLIWLLFALALAGCKAYEVQNADEDKDESGDAIVSCDKLTAHASTCTNTATNIKLRLIGSGTFTMGADDAGAASDESPTHAVTISAPYYIGFYEVTKTQWKSVMGGASGNTPIAGVSWSQIADAGGFVAKLNANAGTIKIGGAVYEYALPSEAQWEFAARGGAGSVYSWGDNEAGGYAWYLGNAASNTHTAGNKKPNGYGLYDTSGNVAEWVQDCFSNYGAAAVTDPIVNDCSGNRIVRGGSFEGALADLRSSKRTPFAKSYSSNAIGFRLALVPKR
ncbi:hypothetical protein AGMMS50229_01650 [Campylobacterota bacterium]|nr:hypothetical protein AGMMS50229_01650 [Campylobacterota bacterium]